MYVRFNHTIPFGRLRNEMEQLFGGLFDNDQAVAGSRTFPAVNIWEDDENVYAEADIPGLKMDDIELFVMGDELTIKGARSDAGEDGTSFHRRERGWGAFNRVIRMPVEIDSGKVKATLRDGVLLITLPKSVAAKPRKIVVKTS